MLKYHIQTVELTSSQATILLNSIPQDFTDLYFVLSARSSRSLVNDYVGIRFNDSTAGFTSRLLVGTGSSAVSGTDSSFGAPRILGDISASTATANTFGSLTAYIPNYSGSATKSFSVEAVTENNGTTAYQEIVAGLWNNTSPITSITLEPIAGGTNNFLAGTSVSLYGVRRGSDGLTMRSAVLATGGTVTMANGYTIHTFNSSGTFVPNTNLEVEYLVIAGGGSSQANNTGAGGAGGYRSSVAGEMSGGGATAEPRLSLVGGTSYTVTIGAGGTTSNGSDSTFHTITSLGGGRGGTYAQNGSSGGSGGGGSFNTNTGGAGTSGQGFAGGASVSSAPPYGTGGGGGAGGLGGNSVSGVRAGHGGVGVFSSITGTSIERAGGGSGSSEGGTQATASGGGGLGPTVLFATAGSGAANTGGGGGGSGGGGSATPGAGGSGVVIIRYLTP